MKELLVSLLGKPEGIVLFQLIMAARFTVLLSLLAFIGGGLVGAVVCTLRISPSAWLQRLGGAYVWLFQSTPLLMLLFIIGLGLPKFTGWDVNPWTAAGLALTLYASAYLAEVWRGAISSIGAGQWEAGRGLGLTFLLTLRLVIVPQAIRGALAPTVGFMVQIIKGTSLAYIIGFHDLMSVGKRWANATVPGTEAFLIYPLLALFYFALCFPLSSYSRWLESRLGSAVKSPTAA
jgi:polar amino acid transport system permease protein